MPAPDLTPSPGPDFVAWRPTAPAAALGLAVEYLCAKPAFARLPFGEWAQTLFWQTARKHYIFALDRDRRIAGYMGWAFAESSLAESWLKGGGGMSNAQCLDGDCVIVNAWAADGEAANDFLRGAAASLFAGRRALYFKRHYPDGRERAVRLPIPSRRPGGPSA
jgi:hemolysin-activating ACP:hemolysin acyltransferase